MANKAINLKKAALAIISVNIIIVIVVIAINIVHHVYYGANNKRYKLVVTIVNAEDKPIKNIRMRFSENPIKFDLLGKQMAKYYLNYNGESSYSIIYIGQDGYKGKPMNIELSALPYNFTSIFIVVDRHGVVFSKSKLKPFIIYITKGTICNRINCNIY